MPCRAIRGLHVLVVLALTPSSMAGMEAKANTWHKVTAAGAPTARYRHTAVLDSQQRMWIFDGFSSKWLNDLHYFSIEAKKGAVWGMSSVICIDSAAWQNA
ncbi:unnamed protein product [Cladocopium goreaui]|uniref:Uncharacterized protein n=1 Tax=Cladocopium goreaui TaxID=2562237 RepID=A0A9P1DA21_9DINO|nr:unnamed protein product [Cladocopium goreaui]